MLSSQWMAAGAGFAFHFLNSKWQEERKARIERVNGQLKNFYGPLLAAVSATKSAYDALIAQHSPDGTRAGFQRALYDNPAGPEGEAYRLWVVEVLQPLNEQAAAIVRDHIDQLDSPRLVPELLQLVAHVSTMRVVLRRWAAGEPGATSAITYPDRLLGHAEAEFNRVKTRQAQLLGEQRPKAVTAAGSGGAPPRLQLRGPPRERQRSSGRWRVLGTGGGGGNRDSSGGDDGGGSGESSGGGQGGGGSGAEEGMSRERSLQPPLRAKL